MTQQEAASYIYDKAFVLQGDNTRVFSFTGIIYTGHLLSMLHRTFPFLSADEVIALLEGILKVISVGKYSTAIDGSLDIAQLGAFKSEDKHRLFQLAFSIVLSSCSYFGMCHKELVQSNRPCNNLWAEYESWQGDILMGYYEQ